LTRATRLRPAAGRPERSAGRQPFRCHAGRPDADTYADNIVIYLDHVHRHLGVIEALRGLQGTAGTTTN